MVTAQTLLTYSLISILSDMMERLDPVQSIEPSASMIAKNKKCGCENMRRHDVRIKYLKRISLTHLTHWRLGDFAISIERWKASDFLAAVK